RRRASPSWNCRTSGKASRTPKKNTNASSRKSSTVPTPTRSERALDVNFQEVVHSAQAVNADVAKPQRFAEDRMDTHKNARLTPKGREEMVRAVVDGGMSKAAAARKFNTTPNTVGKWVKRYLAEGVAGLRDRSSRPLSSPDQTPQATCDAIEVL